MWVRKTWPITMEMFLLDGGLLTCGGVGLFLGGWKGASVAALSLWLSKLHACRGWLAGRLRNGGACRPRRGEEAASLYTYRVVAIVIACLLMAEQSMLPHEKEFYTFEPTRACWKTNI